MLRDAVAVIDIGSSKISGVIGENGINKNYVIHAHSELPTLSLANEPGVIDRPEEFRRVISDVLSTIRSSARANVGKVYFSVPGDFLEIRNKYLQMYLNRSKKLRASDVNDYLLTAKKSIAVSGYDYIASSGVQYFLDGKKKVTRLTGNVTSSIDGLTSFYFAKQRFTETVKEVLGTAGVKEVVFVPVPLAESLLLFNEAERFGFQILLDVGESVTTLSIIYGDGVLFNKSFDVGGGHISGILNNNLKLHDYELAKKIKRKLNLTLPHEYNGIYEVASGEKVYRFDQRKCNEAAEYVITELAAYIDDALKESDARIPPGLNISLTGGGISYMRGAKELLFNAIEIPINIVYPKVSYLSKPEETSKIAVLDYALNYKGV